MALKSNPFEISVTGRYYSLLLPLKIIKPFLDQNIKRVKAKASFEGKVLEFHARLKNATETTSMMFGKRYQKELGIFPNSYFKLHFFENDSKYGVEMTKELDAVLLSDYDAFQIFDSFTAARKEGLSMPYYAIKMLKSALINQYWFVKI